jgi:putative transcriptional regulator
MFVLEEQEFNLLISQFVISNQSEWERGRRVPKGPAQALLRVADRHPEALLD